MTTLSKDEMSRLCDVVMDLILEQGIKSTTMDIVASRLHISKRTLYEIFGSKNEMLGAALDHINETQTQEIERVMSSSENILEAIMRLLILHRSRISGMNIRFLKDMDRLYTMVRPQYYKRQEDRVKQMALVFRLGVTQGLFREGLNYEMLARMFEVQMESLKRAEDLMPQDIALVDIIDSLTITLLRGIVTPKGSVILENLYKKGIHISPPDGSLGDNPENA